MSFLTDLVNRYAFQLAYFTGFQVESLNLESEQ